MDLRKPLRWLLCLRARVSPYGCSPGGLHIGVFGWRVIISVYNTYYRFQTRFWITVSSDIFVLGFSLFYCTYWDTLSFVAHSVNFFLLSDLWLLHWGRHWRIDTLCIFALLYVSIICKIFCFGWHVPVYILVVGLYFVDSDTDILMVICILYPCLVNSNYISGCDFLNVVYLHRLGLGGYTYWYQSQVRNS